MSRVGLSLSLLILAVGAASAVGAADYADGLAPPGVQGSRPCRGRRSRLSRTSRSAGQKRGSGRRGNPRTWRPARPAAAARVARSRPPGPHVPRGAAALRPAMEPAPSVEAECPGRGYRCPQTNRSAWHPAEPIALRARCGRLSPDRVLRSPGEHLPRRVRPPGPRVPPSLAGCDPPLYRGPRLT